jgi:hypothetical protein
MTTRLLRVIDTVRAVREDTRVWVHHLTGEGPATVRRQREAVAQALPAAPLAPLTRTSAYERFGRPETPPWLPPPGAGPSLLPADRFRAEGRALGTTRPVTAYVPASGTPTSTRSGA